MKKTAVVKFDIFNELDIVLAHKRASQICDLTKIGISGRTSFVTAISEICRNCLEFAGSGRIYFYIYNDSTLIEAIITDNGPGIDNIDEVLNKPMAPGVKGCGLRNSRKLVDFFEIETSPLGTTVTLGMRILSKTIPINESIIKGWAQYFETEQPSSPYEEIKRHNSQLLEVTEQLHLKNLEVAEQLVEIKSLNHQLNKNNQELENFAFTISHDLKSPINNLKLLVSIIEQSNNPEQTKEYIKEFRKMIDRLDQMLSGLVEIIDIKNKQDSIAKVIAFEDIFRVVKEELRSNLEEVNAKITNDFKTVPTVAYYEVFLHSIMLNLVSNSIKYRQENKRPEIRISTGKEDDYVVLKIQDNGAGMNLNEVRHSIFKPFKRFNNKIEGKGIGLHLVKSMVENSGGKIEVDSELGKGTTFKLFLKEFKIENE